MRDIPQFSPCIGDEELALLTECIRDNWITGGMKVKEFEEQIACRCEVKHAIACCNGTMALYMGLVALGVKTGDEVIVPDFTFIASANAVVLAGGRPVFVDVDPATFNIDAKAIEPAITPRTKAIMPVHIFGQAADLGDVLLVAKKHHLNVIEDAAQGVGVTRNGIPVGGIGDVGCLSFYADKTITTGEGGMILTNDDAIARQCLILKHQGRTGRGYYVHDHIGYNFRLTDLQAAIGLVQLRKLDWIIAQKLMHDAMYRDRLEGIVQFPSQGTGSVPFRHNIMVDDPEGVQTFLSSKGIGSRRFFYPLHAQPCYGLPGEFPMSWKAYNSGLSLPSSVLLTTDDIDRVCDAVQEAVHA